MTSSRQTRGHLALKSSALAPTAMSYMGQDLILNHMKSHYNRISSAKASVDTSAPKSMKKHIRVRDQKKREGLNGNQSNGPLTPGRRAMSASLENLSCYTPSPSHISRPQSSRQHYRSNSANTRIPSRPQSASGGMPKNSTPSPSPRTNHEAPDMPTDLGKTIKSTPNRLFKNSHFSPPPLPGPLVSHSRWKSVKDRGRASGLRTPADREGIRDERIAVLEREKRTRESSPRDHRSSYREHDMRNSTRGIDEDLTLDLPHEDVEGQLNSYRSGRESARLRYSSRMESGRMSSRLGTPLQRRLRDEREMETKMWEEEQKYMQFISDVTSDILARGIFSNRVLDKVFESHIDNRKDELSEDRMREMIVQLRADLDVENQ